jgi:hypothetical protein
VILCRGLAWFALREVLVPFGVVMERHELDGFSRQHKSDQLCIGLTYVSAIFYGQFLYWLGQFEYHWIYIQNVNASYWGRRKMIVWQILPSYCCVTCVNKTIKFPAKKKHETSVHSWQLQQLNGYLGLRHSRPGSGHSSELWLRSHQCCYYHPITYIILQQCSRLITLNCIFYSAEVRSTLRSNFSQVWTVL